MPDSPVREPEPPQLACADCGLPYSDPGWCDCVIPNEAWAAIAPEPCVPCLHCMARRLEARDMRGVPLLVTSGPFAHEPAEADQRGFARGQAMLRAEREQAA